MSLNAQVRSNSFGNMSIPEDGFISVFADLDFNNGGSGIQPGIISTNRNSKPGVVNFVNSNWTNASDFQHVDGYVRTLSDAAFTFPVGDLGFFRPITISGAKGTTVAYYLDNPKKIATTIARSSAASKKSVIISTNEYWHITGETATNISLNWDVNSDIAELTEGDLSKLRLVAWNGSGWTVLPSAVNNYLIDMNDSSARSSSIASDIAQGSISTTSRIVPDQFTYITFGIEGEDTTDEIAFGNEVFGGEKIEMTVFPNPTFDLSNLRVDYKLSNLVSEADLVIFNAIGELVYRERLTEQKRILSVNHSDNTDGMYQIGIITQNGTKVFKPVVISNR